MSEAQADGWNGSTLTLAADRVQFRTSSCLAPSFNTHEVSTATFIEGFRATPGLLGQSAAAVCVTEVSCNGSWTEPGALLVHGRSAPFLLWDGVFFELERE